METKEQFIKALMDLQEEVKTLKKQRTEDRAEIEELKKENADLRAKKDDWGW